MEELISSIPSTPDEYRKERSKVSFTKSVTEKYAEVVCMNILSIMEKFNSIGGNHKPGDH